MSQVLLTEFNKAESLIKESHKISTIKWSFHCRRKQALTVIDQILWATTSCYSFQYRSLHICLLFTIQKLGSQTPGTVIMGNTFKFVGINSLGIRNFNS